MIFLSALFFSVSRWLLSYMSLVSTEVWLDTKGIPTFTAFIGFHHVFFGVYLDHAYRWKLSHIHYIHRVFLLYGFSSVWKVVTYSWKFSDNHSTHKFSLLCEFSNVQWAVPSVWKLSHNHCICRVFLLDVFSGVQWVVI